MRTGPSIARRSSLHGLLFAALALAATGSIAAPLQRGGDLGAVATGDHLYVGQGSTVVTLASDGTGSPEIVDVTAPLPGLVRGLAIHEGLLFATWRTDEPSGKLALFSLADPAQPEWIADIPYSDSPFLSPGGLTVVGTTLFLVDSEIGLLPIDVSNPQEPVIGTPVTVPGLRSVTQLDAAHLVAWGRSFLGTLNVNIYDISKPSSPVGVGGYGGDNQFDVALGDGFMVLTGQGFQVVDLSDPTNPTLLASQPKANGFTGTVVDGHLLLGWEGAIHVWDLSDPGAPSELPSISAPADRTRLIAPGPAAGETFLLTDTARVLALDTTVAGAPAVEAVLDLPVGVDPTGVASAGSTLFLSDFYSGLRVVDTGLESLGRVDPTSPLPAFEDVAVDGSLALLADWSFGVHTVDVSAPESPAVLGSVEFAVASAVDLAGDRGWATSTTNGGFLVSLDLSDPSQPQITNSIPIGKGVDVFAVGDHVYVADEDAGLRIYDVSGPTPVEVALYADCPFAGAGGVDVQGTLAAVACTNSELHLLDVSDPGVPVQLGVYSDDSLFMAGSAALIDGDVVYFGYTSGLDAVDVADPAAPALIERIALPGGARALAPASTGGAWVAAGMGGAALVQAGGGGPELSFDPASLAFGDVEVGTTSPPQSVALHNSGDADATGIAFSGLPDAGFEADTGACGDTLPAGGSCKVGVTFTPQTVGPATAVLHVASDAGASADLDLSGNGIGGGGPIADISPESFSFTVPAGGSDSDTLNVGNAGDADLEWSLEEAEVGLVAQSMPYGYGLTRAPRFHAPLGSDRAAGTFRNFRRAPADAVVLPAAQPAAIGDFTEGFDDITMLPGAGWALINNSEPVGPSSWFQGNGTVFPSHE
ncbi:MAG: choice-of-anchor D domain-containing protein, partial [Thermoanaerobaculia bacterium]